MFVFSRTARAKVAEETEVDWGKLKKVTVEEKEVVPEEQVEQAKKPEQEELKIDLPKRRESVLVGLRSCRTNLPCFVC